MPYIAHGWEAHWNEGNHYGYDTLYVNDGDEVNIVREAQEAVRFPGNVLVRQVHGSMFYQLMPPRYVVDSNSERWWVAAGWDQHWNDGNHYGLDNNLHHDGEEVVIDTSYQNAPIGTVLVRGVGGSTGPNFIPTRYLTNTPPTPVSSDMLEARKMLAKIHILENATNIERLETGYLSDYRSRLVTSVVEIAQIDYTSAGALVDETCKTMWLACCHSVTGIHDPALWAQAALDEDEDEEDYDDDGEEVF